MIGNTNTPACWPLVSDMLNLNRLNHRDSTNCHPCVTSLCSSWTLVIIPFSVIALNLALEISIRLHVHGSNKGIWCIGKLKNSIWKYSLNTKTLQSGNTLYVGVHEDRFISANSHSCLRAAVCSVWASQSKNLGFYVLCPNVLLCKRHTSDKAFKSNLLKLVLVLHK